MKHIPFHILLALLIISCGNDKKENTPPLKTVASSNPTSPPKVVDSVEEKIQKNLLGAFNAMKRGDFDKLTLLFGDSLKEKISQDRIKNDKQKLDKTLGEFKTIVLHKKLHQEKIVYLLKYEKGMVTLNISMDKNGKFSTFSVKPLLELYKTMFNSMISAYDKGDTKGFMQYYGPKMKIHLPEPKTRQLLKSLITSAGKFKKIENFTMAKPTVAVVVTVFEKGAFKIILSFSPDLKLNGLYFAVHNDIKYPKITDKTTVKEIVTPYIKSKLTKGVMIAIYNKGKRNFQGFGIVSDKKNRKPDENSIFEIGSITKTFTTSILSRLIIQKKIKLSDKAQQFLPKSVKLPTFKGKEITLQHLATHTSSLPRMPANFAKHIKNMNNPYKDYKIKHIYEALPGIKLKVQPGTNISYSNLGMGLLGHIFELKMKKSYEQILKTTILKKLKMNDTSITLSKSQKKRVVQGHDSEGKPTPLWDITSLAGAGAIRSSAKDMMKYLVAHISTKRGALKKAFALSHKVLKTKKGGQTVAMGWFISPLNKKQQIIWHNGGTGGFRSYMGFIKESKTGVVILSNSNVSVDVMGIKILRLLNR
jgi:CubicO group peptidase (beta-lactamase class C family)